MLELGKRGGLIMNGENAKNKSKAEACICVFLFTKVRLMLPHFLFVFLFVRAAFVMRVGPSEGKRR